MEKAIFTKILGYCIFKGTKEEFMNYIEKFQKINIISGNPEVLYNGINDSDLFKYFTGKYSIIIPDGVGTVLASKLVRDPVAEKIAGIDIMKQIIEKCEMENRPVYFLGAEQSVLENCMSNIKTIHKDLNIIGSHNGYFDLENCNDIVQDIAVKRPYAVFVAMGSPRQDMFIKKIMEELSCSIFMGVGGSFDVFAGKLKRAPKWMVNIGLEWLYRVFKEPWRIKRLSSIPKFLLNVLWYNKKH